MRATLKHSRIKLSENKIYQDTTPIECDNSTYCYKLVNNKRVFIGVQQLLPEREQKLEYVGGKKIMATKFTTAEDIINTWENKTDRAKNFSKRLQELATYYDIGWSTAYSWVTKAGIKNQKQQAETSKVVDCEPSTIIEKQQPVSKSISNNMSSDTNLEPQPDEAFQATKRASTKTGTNTIPEENNSTTGQIEPDSIIYSKYLKSKGLVDRILEDQMALSMIKELIRQGAIQ